MLNIKKLIGNITREYLSMIFTSLISGMDAFNTKAPLFNALSIRGRWDVFPANEDCKSQKIHGFISKSKKQVSLIQIFFLNPQKLTSMTIS